MAGVVVYRSIRSVVTILLVIAVGGCAAGASPSVPASPAAAASPAQGSRPSPSPVDVSPAASPSPSGDPSASQPSCVSGDNVFGQDARGPKGDPLGVVRGSVDGIQVDDRVELGDDESGSTLVLVVRDGQEIGRLWLDQDPDGGWLLSQWSVCAGLRVA